MASPQLSQAELIDQCYNRQFNHPTSNWRNALWFTLQLQANEMYDAFTKSSDEGKKQSMTEKGKKIADRLINDIKELVSECTFLDLPYADSLADMIETMEIMDSINDARVAVDFPAYELNMNRYSDMVIKQLKKRGIQL